MSVRELSSVLRADLYRNHGAQGWRGFLKTYMRQPAFRYIFWMRLAGWLQANKYLFAGYWFALWQYCRLGVKYGINIPHTTRIGPGLFIGHFGGIVVHERSSIGRNFSISQGVTIGQKNRGRYKGWPTIGNSVYVGPGACIIGSVSVGSNVAIGANAVVVHDVEDNEVVVGNPAHSVSKGGADSYVTWPCSDA